MISQVIMFRLSITLAHNHPDMYNDFMHMGQPEVAEFIRETYGVSLNRGDAWEDVDAIIRVMQKFQEAKNEG